MPRSTTDRASRPSGVEPGGRPMVAPRRAPNSTAYRRMTASDSDGSSAVADRKAAKVEKRSDDDLADRKRVTDP
jgi:hypothetical protein